MLPHHDEITGYVSSLELPENLCTEIERYLVGSIINKDFNFAFDEEIEVIKKIMEIDPEYATETIAIFSHFLNNVDSSNFCDEEMYNVEVAQATLYELVVKSLSKELELMQ